MSENGIFDNFLMRHFWTIFAHCDASSHIVEHRSFEKGLLMNFLSVIPTSKVKLYNVSEKNNGK